MMNVMNTHSQSIAETGVEKLMAVPVWVQCVGYRCLAYRDREGLWRNFHTHEFLPGVVGLVRHNLTDSFSV
jgi:hypothetical protein